MNEIVVVTVFAVIVCSSLYFLGRIKPQLTLWGRVDLAYYMLAVVGVILLYVSAADNRQRVALLSKLQEQRAADVSDAASEVLNTSFALSDFLRGVMVHSDTCEGPPHANPWIAGACDKSFRAAIGRVFVSIPGSTKLQPQFLGRQLFSNSCKTVIERASDKTMWLRLDTASRPMNEEARKAANKFFLNLVDACKRYEAALTIEDVPPKLDEEVHPQDSLFPTPTAILLARLREWLWPFVLIAALSLKIGKAAAVRAVPARCTP